MKSKNRFGRKCDKIFWFIVLLLPVITYFVLGFYNDAAPDFLTYCEAYRFDFVANIFESVFSLANFGGLPITNFLSYCVGVEIAHVMFDVIVFIPRFSHKLISKAVQDD